jgi:hypothetical protein
MTKLLLLPFTLSIIVLNFGCSGGGGGSFAIPNIMLGDDCQRFKLPASCCTSGIRNSTVGQCADPSTAAQPPIRGSLYMSAAMAGSSAISTENAGNLVGTGPNTNTGANKLAAMANNSQYFKQTGKVETINRSNPKGPADQAKADLFNKIKDVMDYGQGDSYGNAKGNAAMGALEAKPTSGKTTEDLGAGGNRPGVEFESSGGMANAKSGKKIAAIGSNELGGGFGRDGNAIAAPEKASMEANMDEGKEGVNPMLGSDPDDYFTRIDLKDSLFKTVEKQYRKKAENWIAVELKAKTR